MFADFKSGFLLLFVLILCGLCFGATPGWAQQVVINEVDSDTSGSDALEFVELFGAPEATLDGMVLVFFNGNSDASYRAIDLDGFSLNENGFFVTGNASVANVGLVFPNGGLQNGADAVALYQGDATDFPSGTPVTNTNLLDAMVYDTSDADDPGLLNSLTPGMLQLNENAGGSKDMYSNARVPDGGYPLDITRYTQQESTPGTANAPAPAQGWVINEIHADPDSSSGDANGDGLTHSIQDEFVELVNNTGESVNLMGATLADGVRVRHVFGSGVVVPDGCAVVVFGGGLPVGTFGDGIVTTTSTGVLGLNNGGDSVTLSLNGEILATATYGAEGGKNQSLTLAPEVTGDVYEWHTIAPDSGGRRFSPGTRANGDRFKGCQASPLTLISSIQGAAHRSPLVDTLVARVEGIVTEFQSSGFFIQADEAEADVSRSRALFIALKVHSFLKVGDHIRTSGQVTEVLNGRSSGLTVTALVASQVRVLSRGNPLPTPQIIGRSGRMPPSVVISNDAVDGNVLNPGAHFDPEEDALDFFESLEGMRVQVDDALVVGALSKNERFVVVPDGGEGSEVFSSRGALVRRSGDLNPERIIVEGGDGDLLPVRVGARFLQPIVGTLDYRDGRYFLRATKVFPEVRNSALPLEEALVKGDNARLTVAAYNVQNLSPLDSALRFSRIAGTVVRNLHAPDLLMLSEVQDNSGPVNDGVVDARLTYERLLDAIEAEGGPRYRVAEIEPANNQDGGQRGGNIRCGFLYNPVRVTLADAAPGNAVQLVEVLKEAGGEVHLSHNPGRISTNEQVFGGSRKPFAVEFQFNGQTVFLVAAHLDAKLLDDPLFGAHQPPRLLSERRRVLQANVIREFANELVIRDPNANVIVLGDMNDFQFSETLRVLERQSLENLTQRLPEEERYTFIFEGNAQALDHMLATPNLMDQVRYDVLHVNSEYPAVERVSDHDPIRAVFRLPDPALISGGGKPPVILSGPVARPIRTGFTALSVEEIREPLQVEVGQKVTFSVAASSWDGRKLTYGWRFGDGFGGRGAEANHRFGQPGRYTVRVTVSDGDESVEGSLELCVTARMAIPRLRLKLDFSGRGRDRLELSGKIVLSETFLVAGQAVSVNVGDAILTFVLNNRGRAHTDVGRFWLKQKGNGLWRFRMTVAGIALREAWKDEGLTNENIRHALRFMRTTVDIGGEVFSEVRALSYSAREGRVGTAR